MVTHASYVPTPTDIQWAINVIALLNDGGNWVAPSYGVIFQIDKTNKTLKLVAEVVYTPADFFHRTEVVFAAVGYTIVYPVSRK